MTQFQLRRNGRLVEAFEADVDPDDAAACVALLRKVAKDKRLTGDVTLRTWGGFRGRKERNYRT